MSFSIHRPAKSFCRWSVTVNNSSFISVWVCGLNLNYATSLVRCLAVWQSSDSATGFNKYVGLSSGLVVRFTPVNQTSLEKQTKECFSHFNTQFASSDNLGLSRLKKLLCTTHINFYLLFNILILNIDSVTGFVIKRTMVRFWESTGHSEPNCTLDILFWNVLGFDFWARWFRLFQCFRVLCVSLQHLCGFPPSAPVSFHSPKTRILTLNLRHSITL